MTFERGRGDSGDSACSSSSYSLETGDSSSLSRSGSRSISPYDEYDSGRDSLSPSFSESSQDDEGESPSPSYSSSDDASPSPRPGLGRTTLTLTRPTHPLLQGQPFLAGAKSASAKSAQTSSSSPPLNATTAASEKAYLIEPATFPGTPATVHFSVDQDQQQHPQGLPITPSSSQVLPKMFLKYTGVNTNVVKTAFLRAGFRNCPKDKDHFNAVWASPMKVGTFHSFKAYQKVNHFPGTWELGRKDRMYVPTLSNATLSPPRYTLID